MHFIAIEKTWLDCVDSFGSHPNLGWNFNKIERIQYFLWKKAQPAKQYIYIYLYQQSWNS